MARKGRNNGTMQEHQEDIVNENDQTSEDRVDDAAEIFNEQEAIKQAEAELATKRGKAPRTAKASAPKIRALADIIAKQETVPGIERYEQVARGVAERVKAGQSTTDAVDAVLAITKRLVTTMLSEWDQMGGIPLAAMRGFSERHQIVPTRGGRGNGLDAIIARQENEPIVWHVYRISWAIQERVKAGADPLQAADDVLELVRTFTEGIIAEWEASGKGNTMQATKAYFAKTLPAALKASESRQAMLAKRTVAASKEPETTAEEVE